MAGPVLETDFSTQAAKPGQGLDASPAVTKYADPLTAATTLFEPKPEPKNEIIAAGVTKEDVTTDHQKLRHNNLETSNGTSAGASVQSPAITINNGTSGHDQLHDHILTTLITKKKTALDAELERFLQAHPSLAAQLQVEQAMQMLKQAQEVQGKQGLSPQALQAALDRVATNLKGDQFPIELVIPQSVNGKLVSPLDDLEKLLQTAAKEYDVQPAASATKLIELQLAAKRAEVVEALAKLAEFRAKRAPIQRNNTEPESSSSSAVKPVEQLNTGKEFEAQKLAEQKAQAKEGASRALDAEKERVKIEKEKKQEKESRLALETERILNIAKKAKELEAELAVSILINNTARQNGISAELNETLKKADVFLTLHPEVKEAFDKVRENDRREIENSKQKFHRAITELHDELNSSVWVSDYKVLTIIKSLPEEQRGMIHKAYFARFGEMLAGKLQAGLSKDECEEALRLCAADSAEGKILISGKQDLAGLEKAIQDSERKFELTVNSTPDEIKTRLTSLAKAVGEMRTDEDRNSAKQALASAIDSLGLGREAKEKLVAELNLNQIAVGSAVERRQTDFKSANYQIGILKKVNKDSPDYSTRLAALEKLSASSQSELVEMVASKAEATKALTAIASTEQQRGAKSASEIDDIASHFKNSDSTELLNRLDGRDLDFVKALDERVKHYNNGAGIRELAEDKFNSIEKRRFTAQIEGHQIEARAAEFAQALSNKDRAAAEAVILKIPEDQRDQFRVVFDSRFASYISKQERVPAKNPREHHDWDYITVHAGNMSEALSMTFSGDDVASVKAALGRNQATQDALALKEYFGGWRDSTRQKGAEYFESMRLRDGSLDAQRINAALKAYQDLSSNHTRLETELINRNTHIDNWALAIMRRDEVGAAVHKALQASDGAGTNEKLLHEAFLPPPALQSLLKAADDGVIKDPGIIAKARADLEDWNAKVALRCAQTAGHSSYEIISSELSGTDLRVQRSIMNAGYKSDALTLFADMDGAGTSDEARIRRILEARMETPEKLELLDKQYREVSGGESLIEALRGDLSGDDLLHAELACVTIDPKIKKLDTEKQAAAILERRIELIQNHLQSSWTYGYKDAKLSTSDFLIPGASTVKSVGVLAEKYVSYKTKSEQQRWDEELKRAQSELVTVKEMMNRGESTAARLADIKIASMGIQSSGTGLVDARAQVATEVGEGVAFVVTTAGTVVVVAVTAGGAAPVVAGAIAAGTAVVGGGARIVTKYAISGDSATDDLADDFKRTGVEAVTQFATGSLLAWAPTAVGSKAGNLVTAKLGAKITEQTGRYAVQEGGQLLIKEGGNIAVAQAGGALGGLAEQSGSQLFSGGIKNAAKTRFGNVLNEFSGGALSARVARVPGQVVQGVVDGAVAGTTTGAALRGVDNFDHLRNGDFSGWLAAVSNGVVRDAEAGALVGGIFGGTLGFFHTPKAISRGRMLNHETMVKELSNPAYGKRGSEYLNQLATQKGFLTAGDLELATLGSKQLTPKKNAAVWKDLGIEIDPTYAPKEAAKGTIVPEGIPSAKINPELPKLTELDALIAKASLGQAKIPDSVTVLGPKEIDIRIAQERPIARQSATDAKSVAAGKRIEALEKMKSAMVKEGKTIDAKPGDVREIETQPRPATSSVAVKGELPAAASEAPIQASEAPKLLTSAKQAEVARAEIESPPALETAATRVTSRASPAEISTVTPDEVFGTAITKTPEMLAADKEVAGMKAMIDRAKASGRPTESLDRLLSESLAKSDELYAAAAKKIETKPIESGTTSRYDGDTDWNPGSFDGSFSGDQNGGGPRSGGPSYGTQQGGGARPESVTLRGNSVPDNSVIDPMSAKNQQRGGPRADGGPDFDLGASPFSQAESGSVAVLDDPIAMAQERETLATDAAYRRIQERYHLSPDHEFDIYGVNSLPDTANTPQTSAERMSTNKSAASHTEDSSGLLDSLLNKPLQSRAAGQGTSELDALLQKEFIPGQSRSSEASENSNFRGQQRTSGNNGDNSPVDVESNALRGDIIDIDGAVITTDAPISAARSVDEELSTFKPKASEDTQIRDILESAANMSRARAVDAEASTKRAAKEAEEQDVAFKKKADEAESTKRNEAQESDDRYWRARAREDESNRRLDATDVAFDGINPRDTLGDTGHAVFDETNRLFEPRPGSETPANNPVERAAQESERRQRDFAAEPRRAPQASPRNRSRVGYAERPTVEEFDFSFSALKEADLALFDPTISTSLSADTATTTELGTSTSSKTGARSRVQTLDRVATDVKTTVRPMVDVATQTLTETQTQTQTKTQTKTLTELAQKVAEDEPENNRSRRWPRSGGGDGESATEKRNELAFVMPKHVVPISMVEAKIVKTRSHGRPKLLRRNALGVMEEYAPGSYEDGLNAKAQEEFQLSNASDSGRIVSSTSDS